MIHHDLWRLEIRQEFSKKDGVVFKDKEIFTPEYTQYLEDELAENRTILINHGMDSVSPPRPQMIETATEFVPDKFCKEGVKEFMKNQGEWLPSSDNSNKSAFDQELRDLINKYSQDAPLSAGEVVAVLTFVTHELIHRALKLNDDYQL
jgi:hypothetical protein